MNGRLKYVVLVPSMIVLSAILGNMPLAGSYGSFFGWMRVLLAVFCLIAINYYYFRLYNHIKKSHPETLKKLEEG